MVVEAMAALFATDEEFDTLPVTVVDKVPDTHVQLLG
jgi:hypothetical protein